MSFTTHYSSKPARAETTIGLSNSRVLRIVTAKAQGYLSTRATVARVEGNSFVHAMFSDFNEALVRCPAVATDANVRRQHEGALVFADQLAQRAAQFYEDRIPFGSRSAAPVSAL